jgi:DNA-binding winged helix-turn-helix (wHTH) protein
VTIRILADREPYSAFADQPRGEIPEGAGEPFVLLSGPAALDDPNPDIIVLPTEDYFALGLSGRLDPGYDPFPGTLFIPYGPVALMEKAFDMGCSDYLREPWGLPELRARCRRFAKRRFKAGSGPIELRDRELMSEGGRIELSEGEAALLRLLLVNAPIPVTKAALLALTEANRREAFVLGRCVASLRRKMDNLQPGLGAKLITIRKHGYRLDVRACG